MAGHLLLMTYSFVAAVGIALYFQPGPEIAMPLYIVAALTGVVGWGLAWREEKGLYSKKMVVAGLIFVSAVSLGAGRYAASIYIPPFDENAPSNHIKSFVEEFPDVDRKDVTRIIGRIVAEPEYRPVEDRPGVVLLMIEPELAAPDADAGQTFPIEGGIVMVALRPSGPFRGDEKDYQDLFAELSVPEGYGYTIECNVALQVFRPADNPGLFNAEDFYNDKEIFATGSINFWDHKKPPMIITDRSKGNPIVELALAIKTGMLGVIKMTMPFPESAFLAGVTLGTDRGLDGIRCIFEEAPPGLEKGEDVVDLRQLILDEFRWSGTTHILSVSGLHVTIIAGALWALFVILRIPRKIYTVMIICALIIFAFITGAEAPTVRAVIMNSLVLVTFVYFGASLRASLLMAIGTAAFLILLYNPKLIIGPSFALSFMAMLSLGLMTPPSEEILSRIPGINKLSPFLLTFLAAQVAIQLGMMGPLSAYFFCRMSLAGPFANFLAIPLSDIIIQLGLFASLLGMIPDVGMYMAITLNAANYLLIWFFLWSTHLTTIFFPYPYIQTMTPLMLASYYALLSLYIWHKPLIRTGRILYYDLVMGIGGGPRKTKALAYFGGLFVFTAVCATGMIWPRQPSGDLRVNVLSVRYGNSIHIETPGGAQILVDAGPNDFRSGWNTGERSISQYLLKDRVGSLDALIMSTTSPEDIGGVAAMLKIFPTRRFYSPVPVWNWNIDDPDAFTSEASAALQSDVAQGRTRNPDFEDDVFHLSEIALALKQPWGFFRFLEVALISPTSLFTSFGPPECFEVTGGMVLWQEENPNGRFRIIALHPNPDFPLKPENNNSVVLRVEYGETAFLLTGDITADGVRELLRIPPELLKANVIVAPAHGSAKANVPRLYEIVNPDTAIISYGYSRDLKPRQVTRGRSKDVYRDSLFDHRQLFMRDIEAGTNQTEMSLAASGISVARTDKNGAILCRSDGRNVTLQPMIGVATSGDAIVAEEAERNKEF